MLVTNQPAGRQASLDGSQSTLQLWAGGAVVSAPILVSEGQRFESSPVHFFSLLSSLSWRPRLKRIATGQLAMCSAPECS